MKLYQLLSKFSTSNAPVCIIDNSVAIEYPDAARLKVLANRDGSPLSMRNVESHSITYGTYQIRLKREDKPRGS